MIEESLRYPLNSDDRVATLIIGGLLVPLSLLVLPAFVLQGYLVRVLRSAATGEAEAPSFTDWGGLFVDGLKLLVINLAVGLVIAVPFVVVFAVFVGGVSSTGNGAGTAGVGFLWALLLGVIGLFTIVISYFVPAMVTNFAMEGRIGAAFDLSTIRSIAFTTDYLVGILLGVVVGSLINTIAILPSLFLIGLPILFYGQVVTYYLFGRAYAEGRSAAGLPPATDASTRTSTRTTDRSGGV